MELTKENVDFIQSACNPIAVSMQFAEWIKAEYLKDISKGTDHLLENKLLLGVLGKLCSMFKLDHDEIMAYEYCSDVITTDIEYSRLTCNNNLKV